MSLQASRLRAYHVTLGFTLLELLIVMALTALLGLISALIGQRWFSVEKVHIMSNTLAQSLEFAKQAAIAQGQAVTLCAAASDDSCGDDWAQGILIFLDPQNAGHFSADSLLLRVQPFSTSGTLIWRGFLPAPHIHFAQDGLPHGYHGSFYMMTDHKEQAILVMNVLGRIRLPQSENK